MSTVFDRRGPGKSSRHDLHKDVAQAESHRKGFNGTTAVLKPRTRLTAILGRVSVRLAIGSNPDRLDAHSPVRGGASSFQGVCFPVCRFTRKMRAGISPER